MDWVAGDVLRPSPQAPLSARLLSITRGLEELLARYRPDSCAFESVYQHRNPRSALTLGQAQAAAIIAVAARELPVIFYSPSEVKQALTGSGRAAKEQVRFMVERILGVDLADAADDLSDALAVAICHAGRASGVVAGAGA